MGHLISNQPSASPPPAISVSKIAAFLSNPAVQTALSAVFDNNINQSKVKGDFSIIEEGEIIAEESGCIKTPSAKLSSPPISEIPYDSIIGMSDPNPCPTAALNNSSGALVRFGSIPVDIRSEKILSQVKDLNSLLSNSCLVGGNQSSNLQLKSENPQLPGHVRGSEIQSDDGHTAGFGIVVGHKDAHSTQLLNEPIIMVEELRGPETNINSGPNSPNCNPQYLGLPSFNQPTSNPAKPTPNLCSQPSTQNILQNKNYPNLTGLQTTKSLTIIPAETERNRFSGHIPSSVGELTQLTRLQLGGNCFADTIPTSIRRLRNLTQLHLDRNQLSGSIPDVFSELTSLISMRLSGNTLTGTIPLSILATAPNIRYLELGGNSLNGPIPDFLGKFRALDTLDLSRNKFSGTVPKTFANLTKIFNLDMSRNNLVDPFPKLHVRGIESLDLSYNNFHLGKIPEWITYSPIIYSLKLAKCGIKIKLDDWNPAETYFYDYIDLSENEITGSPAKLLNRTDYLVGFYASNNKLKFTLENTNFARTLRFLDMSRNSLFGKVPKAVTILSKLNVSYNHLCGQLLATKFLPSSFAGNDCLCGSSLPKCKA
ncbi:Leucine-rich repeat (LRR) family protein [Striga hermonthica]|uniref:Leucine-rich repeat (LRR) family protein n=1 Tax=Striga hermonthica TaxID=68872 RepID=A0A9N7RHK3_STRHE|nr:Leucine-rich repeat (LRR) family protein [Striga hermonthica]